MDQQEVRHFGVRGMKWGVRKAESSGGGSSNNEKNSAPSRKVQKADKKFEKRAGSRNVHINVYNGAARHVNKYDVDRINNKPKYKNVDFNDPKNYKLEAQYHKEFEDAFNNALKKSASDLGTNASGTRQYAVSIHPDGSWSVHTEAVKHAEELAFKIIPKYNAEGFIISVSIETEGMEHSSTRRYIPKRNEQAKYIPKNHELTHYGVKGMKWGVSNKQERAAARVKKGGELVKQAKARGSSNPARSTALRGAAEVAGILVGGSIVANRIPGGPNLRNASHIAKLIAAGRQGAIRVGEIRAINAYNESKEG